MNIKETFKNLITSKPVKYIFWSVFWLGNGLTIFSFVYSYSFWFYVDGTGKAIAYLPELIQVLAGLTNMYIYISHTPMFIFNFIFLSVSFFLSLKIRQIPDYLLIITVSLVALIFNLIFSLDFSGMISI